MKLPVHRIIPFSNVEGIGNRTSIFVQGCNANCLYCHNSETIAKVYDGVVMYTVDELVELIRNNMPFIRGITVSGGEATLYHGFLGELFERVRELGLTCYVDTNGFFDLNQISPLIEVTDKFLYDIKGMGAGLTKLCFSEELLDNQRIDHGYDERYSQNQEHFKNIEELLQLGKVEEVRLVYVKGFYDATEVIERISKVLAAYPEVTFKLIKAHAKGLPIERLKLLKGTIPTVDELNSVEALAKAKGIKNMITIG